MNSFTILLALLLQYGILPCASVRCDRTTRLSLGNQKEFELQFGDVGSCQHRLRAPRGLHVKVALRRIKGQTCHLNLTVLDTSEAPSGWSARQFENYDQIQIGHEETYQTSSMGLSVVRDAASSGTCSFVFVAEAVIPASGVCGFEANATDSGEVIKSPGFPNRKAPRNLRCLWIIKSRPQHFIKLEIQKFKTQYVDYLEVYDGTQRLNRLFGKHRNYFILKYIAYSGEMRLYFLTKTSESKGFRAKFMEVKANETNEPFLERPKLPSNGLRCHKRRKWEMDGRVFSHSHSKVVCPAGNLCYSGKIISMQRSDDNATFQDVSEEAKCTPPHLCNICQQGIVQNSSEISSCEEFCCSTDLCNTGENWPDDPPVEGLRCKLDERRYLSTSYPLEAHDSGSGGNCPAGTVCGLYMYQGLSAVSTTQGHEVSGYVARCLQPNACNEEACISRYDIRGINVTSCEATCCVSDKCNDPFGNIPTPTPPGSVTRCRNIYQSYSKYEVFSNFTREDDCYDFNSRCLRIDVIAADTDGTEYNITQGECMSKENCDWLQGCSRVTDRLGPMTIKSCQASCCDSDLCNAFPL